MVKNPPANAGDTRDLGSIPELGRSPGGGCGSPLQYSCGENPTYRWAWRAIVHMAAESDMTEATEHARIHTVRPKTTPFNKLSYINILAQVHFMWNIVHRNMFVIIKSQKQPQCQWVTDRLNILYSTGLWKRIMSIYSYWYRIVSNSVFFCEEKKKTRDTGRMDLSLATKATKKNSRSLGMSWFS